jgi:26S proteasome regulatory subunit N10
LKKFIETVNPKDGTGSNLVTIPAGPHLTDALVSSPVVQSESGAVPSVVPNGGGGFEFGFDPNDDPELALALRVSMEENRARQTQEANADTPAENVPTTGAEISGAPEDEAMLERALEMSNQKGEQKIEEQTGLATMTEEQQIEYAMKMSMQTGDETDDESKEKMDVDASDKEKSSTAGENKKDEDYSEVINDPEFLQSVLESLPGVDPHSDAMQQAMAALTGSSKKEEADSEKKDNEDEK